MDRTAKLTAQIADLTAKQEAALDAAAADGVSAEDQARHTAEFDRLQAEKDKANASLARERKLAAEKAAFEAAEREPARPAIVAAPYLPPGTGAGRAAVPSNVRRYGPLRAYKGQDADAHAYQAGLWVLATQFGHAASREQYQAQYGPLAATLSTTSNTGAAYFVPDVMDTTIARLTEEYGVARRVCRVQPMTSDTWTGPRWTGTLTTSFVGEGQAPAQTEQSYDAISLTAKSLAAYGKMTSQLREDAVIDLGDEWTNAAAIAFAQKEDDCLFNGDGTSAFGGITGLLKKLILAANAASLVTATGHATLGALTLGDFWTVVGALPRFPGIDPRWYCHKEVYAASMGPLQTAAGGVTLQDIANGGVPRFLGYPVEFVNVMPKAASVTTGVTGIVFGDVALAATFGDRRQRTFESGRINDDMIKQLVTLFTSERFDINVHTVVDPKDSTKAGPVLGLKLG